MRAWPHRPWASDRYQSADDRHAGPDFMKQQDEHRLGATSQHSNLQPWHAPVVNEFDVGEITKADSNPGDDGLGVFTHS